MSATVRTALAQALSGVLGVNRVTPYYRSSTRPGDGWVSFAGRTRDDSGLGFMDTWEIRVALHQDIREAEEWFDTHSDTLTAALKNEIVVEGINMVTLVTDTGTTPGIVITGVRAH